MVKAAVADAEANAVTIAEGAAVAAEGAAATATSTLDAGGGGGGDDPSDGGGSGGGQISSELEVTGDIVQTEVEAIASLSIAQGDVLDRTVTITAVVLRTRPAGSLAFLDLASDTSDGAARIQLMAHKKYLCKKTLALVRSVIAVGDTVRCAGRPGTTRGGTVGEVTLFATDVELLRVRQVKKIGYLNVLRRGWSWVVPSVCVR